MKINGWNLFLSDGWEAQSINFGRWCKIIILWNKCIFFSSFYTVKVWQKKNMLKIVPRRRVYLCSDWLAIDFFSHAGSVLSEIWRENQTKFITNEKPWRKKTKFRCSRMITSLVYWIKVKFIYGIGFFLIHTG